jgi:hypothetical protein
MYLRFRQLLAMVLLAFMVAACATNPAPDPQSVAYAKQFLHSWGAGQIAMASFERRMKQEESTQPGMAALVRQAFAGTTPEDFENIAAPVYARHLSRENLAALAQFTATRAGNRFFRVAVAGELKHQSTKDITRQLSAVELAAAIKFARTDAFKEMKRELPTINREMAEAAGRWGKAKMRAYMNRQ